jgi:hypothetical protein
MSQLPPNLTITMLLRFYLSQYELRLMKDDQHALLTLEPEHHH